MRRFVRNWWANPERSSEKRAKMMRSELFGDSPCRIQLVIGLGKKMREQEVSKIIGRHHSLACRQMKMIGKKIRL